ncbi:mechanosensitive ion channel domain-containing protein [Swingsia samuiensis]|uniref:Mechanosensitive ion channel n=1 Tax=Swingsia samuiensis TaxID=1293412 RepID=A0A4Y6UGI5_9PROT|nr:mechanosensitive ion channel domain-containing protein [Swingsia samuiensis]QDH16682.1 mechanosensitive ion channel [Swingsia samuiensis]
MQRNWGSRLIREKQEVFKSDQSQRRSIFPAMLAFLCLCLLAVPQKGFADVSADNSHKSVQQAPRLTSDQTQQLLGVLDNDKKRQEFITTLKNLSAAQQQGLAPGKKATPGAAPAKQNLGEALLSSLVVGGKTVQHEGQILIKTIGNFRSLGPWLLYVRDTPDAQNEIIKILIRIGILVVGGGVASFLLKLVLRRPKQIIENKARQNNLRKELSEHRKMQDVKKDAQDDLEQEKQDVVQEKQNDELLKKEQPSEKVETEAERLERVEQEQADRLRHQGSLVRLMLALSRLPFSLGCFILDLIPIALFPIVALLIQTFDVNGDVHTIEALDAIAWIGGVAAFGFVALMRAIFSPDQVWLRLAMVGDTGARFWFVWLRRLAITFGTCYSILSVFSTFGMPDNVVIAFGKIMALVLHVMIAVMILQARRPISKACNRIADHSRFSGLIRFLGHFWWVAALFFDLGLWLVWAAEIRGGYEQIAALFLWTCVAVIIIRLLSIMAYGCLERLFKAVPIWLDLNDESKERLSRYRPAVRRAVSFVMGVVSVVVFSIAWGVPVKELLGHGSIGIHLLSSLSTIVVAVILGMIVWEAANIFIERHVEKIKKEPDGFARVARLRTLHPMFRIILMTILIVIIGLTVLSELGINTAPLLASASIFGVALGFGSQKLVQDFISGIFLLMENALTVGDAVTLNGTYGVIDKLSLRTVHVRANDGSINIFPFSSLSQIVNYNRDFARALIVAEVGYSVDTDAVVQAFRDITAGLREDPDFKHLIIDDFQLGGVDSLNDSSVTVKGTLPTTPDGRWPVQRQFYRRMKKYFEEHGIDMPFPTRTLEIPALESLVKKENKQGEAQEEIKIEKKDD